MANIRQFNKGETITITVTADDISNMEMPVLYVYPDDLNLDVDPDLNKIHEIKNPTTLDNSIIFTISDILSQDADMPAGDYTIELKYGIEGTNVTIVKQTHAFTLVESGYNKKR